MRNLWCNSGTNGRSLLAGRTTPHPTPTGTLRLAPATPARRPEPSKPLPGPTARITHRGDGIVAAELGSTCIAFWRKDSTMERFDLQRTALLDTVRRFPKKAAFFCVVEESSGAPGEDVRRATSKMFESLEADLRGVAMIIEGTGFRSALVRSVAAGIVMLMPKRVTPISYFAHIGEGAQWLQQHVELGSSTVYAQRVRELRVALDP